jgi:Xaa-Pro dipeptidase
MPAYTVFPNKEFERRLTRVRDAMLAQDLDALLVGVPENIYYLTGLDHWGYFASHLLIVPLEGRMALVARSMERITVENQVATADFHGYADHEDPAAMVASVLSTLSLASGRLGLEKRSLFVTPHLAERVQAETEQADWRDCSGLIDEVRYIQSDLEMQYTRRAAAAADEGTRAAIAAIRDGASDYEVAAECQRAMILAGSEYPGFGPFIRPTSRLGEEHTTWRGDVFRNGEAVFLELAAAYRKYQAPMGRLVYIGQAPKGAEVSAELAIRGMQAICQAIRPDATAGEVYAAWTEVVRSAGLANYARHHCGYLVGIGFPPSWTGGSAVRGLAPNAEWRLQEGMTFHAHSWFTNTDCVDYFISNTVMLTANGCEVLTSAIPETLIVA